MNGLSSTMFAKTTSFAQPMQSRSAVASAVALTVSAIRSTASMLVPARVVATFTEAHTPLGDRECLGYRVDEPAVAVTDALVHERRVAADEVDSDLGCCPVERESERRDLAAPARRRKLGDRSDRDAAVHDRYAVLGRQLLGHRHEVLGGAVTRS